MHLIPIAYVTNHEVFRRADQGDSSYEREHDGANRQTSRRHRND